MTIGQDPIIGAEQRGTTFWKRVYKQFHEQRKLPPYKFESDRNGNSLSKWWSQLIQGECSKFQAAYDHVKARPVSGIGWRTLFSKQWHTVRRSMTPNSLKAIVGC